ncbi:cadherin-like beta sandwich domain-containing protein [Paenibacillus sp. D51F]
MNDEQSPYGYASFTLKSGANTFKVKAVNKLGQTAETIRTITFNPSAPILALGYAPEKTSSARVTLTWTVSDENDYSPKVFLNDQLIYSDGGSVNLDLKPGLNTFNLAATNSYGKTTEITYTVTLEEAAVVPG